MLTQLFYKRFQHSHIAGIQEVLGLHYDQYVDYLRDDMDMEFDPFYALSQVAVAVGTVGPEHLEAMKLAFPSFKDKYYRVEDSIWPWFWMLPEQVERKGEVLEVDQIWDAKEKAESRMIEYLKDQLGVTLQAGRPTITEARRFADFKANIFFTKMPGEGDLQGIYYMTADPAEGGLGFNVIIGGKAHGNDQLSQRWVNTLKQYVKDPKLEGRFALIIWNTEVSQYVIQGSKASLQTSVPPLEAAGMKDKKDLINYNLPISSATGGPVQYVQNIF